VRLQHGRLLAKAVRRLHQRRSIMSLSETIATAEGRIQEVVENGRTRLRAVADDAERRVEASMPRMREQLDTWRDRGFEDAERVGGYVTEGLSRIGARLPKVELPFAGPLPTPEELVDRWFDTSSRALALQRKLALAWIAALKTRRKKGERSQDESVRSAA
jgi:hypothetical protein